MREVYHIVLESQLEALQLVTMISFVFKGSFIGASLGCPSCKWEELICHYLFKINTKK